MSGHAYAQVTADDVWQPPAGGMIKIRLAGAAIGGGGGRHDGRQDHDLLVQL
jgi:hypothetical protein